MPKAMKIFMQNFMWQKLNKKYTHENGSQKSEPFQLIT